MKLIAEWKTDKAWFTALLGAAQNGLKTAKTAELKIHYQNEIERYTQRLAEINDHFSQIVWKP
jgi:hypothetical protein